MVLLRMTDAEREYRRVSVSESDVNDGMVWWACSEKGKWVGVVDAVCR